MRHVALTALILYLLHGCRSPCFLSCAAPVKKQAGADERHGAADKFRFKQNFVLSARRDRRQHHGAQRNQKRERAGNPHAGPAAGNQHGLAFSFAVWPMRQLDGRRVHIKEGNEVENHRHRHQKLISANHRGVDL